MDIISRCILTLSVFLFSYFPPLHAGDHLSPLNADSTLVNKLDAFKLAMQESNPSAGEYYEWILNYLASHDIRDSILLSDCYYYTGTYKYLTDSYDESEGLLQKSIRYRLAKDSIDDIYAKARTNLGLSYYYSGQLEQARENLELAVATREELFGPSTPILLKTLVNLSAIYIDMGMYERALSVSARGIQMAEEYPDVTEINSLVNLHFNTGVSYMNIFDFNRAKRNFELAYSLISRTESSVIADIIRSYISLAACNFELNNIEESEYYFNRALALVDSTHFKERLLYSLYDNYSRLLSEIEDIEGARKYLLMAVDEAERTGFIEKELDQCKAVVDNPSSSRLAQIKAQSKLLATALDHPSHCRLTHFTIASSEHSGYCFILANEYITELVLDYLVTVDQIQVWHNASFDFKHIYYHTGKFPKNYHDTAILAKTLVNHVETFKAKVGLKELAGEWYGDWGISEDNFPVCSDSFEFC